MHPQTRRTGSVTLQLSNVQVTLPVETISALAAALARHPSGKIRRRS
jgi:hypothetical protein